MMKDEYCWFCHQHNEKFRILHCKQCFRGYHASCAASDKRFSDVDLITDEFPQKFINLCNECTYAHIALTKWRSSEHYEPMNQGDLSELLKDTMKAVDSKVPRTYRNASQDLLDATEKTLVALLDWKKIKTRIDLNYYRCPEDYWRDCLLINHNIAIAFGRSSRPSTESKTFLDYLRKQLDIIELCPHCISHYYNKSNDWIIWPCPWGHPLIWATLKGYPAWPAKLLKYEREKRKVHIIFFQTHDRHKLDDNKCKNFSPEDFRNPPKIVAKYKVDYNIALEEAFAYNRKLLIYFPMRVFYNEEKKYLNPSFRSYICRRANRNSDEDDSTDCDENCTHQSQPARKLSSTLIEPVEESENRVKCKPLSIVLEDVMVKFDSKPGPLQEKLNKLAKLLEDADPVVSIYHCTDSNTSETPTQNKKHKPNDISVIYEPVIEETLPIDNPENPFISSYVFSNQFTRETTLLESNESNNSTNEVACEEINSENPTTFKPLKIENVKDPFEGLPIFQKNLFMRSRTPDNLLINHDIRIGETVDTSVPTNSSQSEDELHSSSNPSFTQQTHQPMQLNNSTELASVTEKGDMSDGDNGEEKIIMLKKDFDAMKIQFEHQIKVKDEDCAHLLTMAKMEIQATKDELNRIKKEFIKSNRKNKSKEEHLSAELQKLMSQSHHFESKYKEAIKQLAALRENPRCFGCDRDVVPPFCSVVCQKSFYKKH